MDLQKQLEPFRDLRPETLPHEELVRHFVSQTAPREHLLGVVREQAERIDELQGEIRRLRWLPDRPRGTGGPGTPSAGETGGGSSQSSAHSSEQERREREPRKPWSKAAKLPSLTLDDTVTLTIPAAQLPPDTKLKGYEETTVRDLLIRRVVLRFRRARYPSALTGKS